MAAVPPFVMSSFSSPHSSFALSMALTSVLVPFTRRSKPAATMKTPATHLSCSCSLKNSTPKPPEQSKFAEVFRTVEVREGIVLRLRVYRRHMATLARKTPPKHRTRNAKVVFPESPAISKAPAAPSFPRAAERAPQVPAKKEAAMSLAISGRPSYQRSSKGPPAWVIEVALTTFPRDQCTQMLPTQTVALLSSKI
jgi:hypothetical protein